VIWFMSDPHYAHKNIIRGCSEWPDKEGCRDFDTFTAHNDWLVRSINRKVKPNDVLWCLGDWSFGGQGRISEFRDRLKVGHIHLILGNHDTHVEEENQRRKLFESIRHYAELQPRKKGPLLVLFHYPISSWHHKGRGAVHLHGHIHRPGDTKTNRFNVAPEANWLLNLDDIEEMRTK